MAIETKKFITSGMHCPSCSMLIELSLGDVDGVESASSDYKTGITEVTYDAGVLTPEAIVAEIEKAGYIASIA
jgi:copper chaperone